MRTLDDYELAWIKEAAEAMRAIRAATGYLSLRTPGLNPRVTSDISWLVDRLHNIDMIATGNPMFRELHPPEKLDALRLEIRRLRRSGWPMGLNNGPNPFTRMYRAIRQLVLPAERPDSPLKGEGSGIEPVPSPLPQE